MIPPVTNVSVNKAVLETAERRKIFVELSKIKDNISKSQLEDDMTQAILLWCNYFIDSLRTSADINEIMDAYIEQLQELLQDPITETPLDKGSYLGSDGVTYGKKALAIYFNSVPEEYHNKSPLDPNSKQGFTVDIHPIVNEMLLWLEAKGKLLTSDKLEEAYNQIEMSLEVESEELEEFEEDEDDSFEAMKRAAEARKLRREIKQIQENNEIDESINNLRTILVDAKNQMVAGHNERLDQIYEKQNRRIEQIKLNDEKALKEVKLKIEELNSDIRQLERDEKELVERIQNISADTDVVIADTLKLEQSIIQVAKALKKKKRDFFKTIITTIAISVACVALTWAAAEFLPALAGNLKFIPIPGGAIASLTFKG